MKVYFETLGCPKNFNDTEVAKALVLNSGNEIASSPEMADAIVVNTCSFINDAKKESIETIFDMSKFGKKLIVSGCLAKRYGKELLEEMPEVDSFIGVNDYDKLIDCLLSGERKAFQSENYPCVLPKLERKLEDNPYSATIKISEGCNNCCTYCAIPGIRGRFRSKTKEDIIAEAKELASKGTKELILIAEDLTNYGMDIYKKLALPELLEELNKIDGITWIRLMYCYEDRITDELIDAISRLEKVCHYIDIPLQHVSNNVLKSMKRRSSEESIRNTIKRLRKKIPDIHIRTTFIVGFPGETEEDFELLSNFVDDTKFARLGVFAYSQEEDTVAFDMPNQIDEEIKESRVNNIMSIQLPISSELNSAKIGRVFKVLVEGKDVDGSYYGRTEYDAPEIDNSVLFTSNNELKPGTFVNVLINDSFDYDICGVEV